MNNLEQSELDELIGRRVMKLGLSPAVLKYWHPCANPGQAQVIFDKILEVCPVLTTKTKDGYTLDACEGRVVHERTFGVAVCQLAKVIFKL